MSRHHALIAAPFIAGSRLGLTIGRPIVQSSTWHFTYAETLQFPYPITVTVLQLVVTYALLLGLALLISVYEYGFATFSPRANAQPDSPTMDTSSGYFRNQTSKLSQYLGLKFGPERTATIQILVLAISVATADVLTTSALSNAPFEIFLLACSFTVPVSVFAVRHFAARDVVPSKVTFPAMMLFLGIFVAAYRPNLPHSPKMIWVAVLSSLFATVWPFLLERALRSPSDRSETRYERVDSGLTDHVNTLDLSDNSSILQILQHTLLLATLVLIPILVYSGELGHIYRNCYFLNVPSFWIFLFAGAAFRFILLVSSTLFIKSASALSFIILMTLIEVSQVTLATHSSLLSSQWLALVLCLLTGIWFYWLSHTSSIELAATSDSFWLGDEPRQDESLFQKYRLQPLLRAAALICLLAGFIQIRRESGPQTSTKEDSPTSNNKDSPIPEILRGTDAYLGQRPRPDAVANFSVLIEECRGTYDHLDNVYDVYRCLRFLSSKQQQYIEMPIGIADRLSTSSQGHFKQNSSNVDLSGSVPIADTSKSLAGKCNGPTIPYHIWWTGLPTWRIELFIKSYLYTQNLDCSQLWIWINGDHHPGAMAAWLQSSRFQRFLPLVSEGSILLKEWILPSRVPLPQRLDPLDTARYYKSLGVPNTSGERLVADSIIRDASGHEWIEIYPQGDAPQLTYYMVAVSDAARLIILHLHGGVYLDPDMLLQRDLRPLLLPSRGFSERWGTSSAPEAYNNGLLALPANSSLSSYLLWAGTRMGRVYHFLALGRALVREGRDDRDIEDPRALLKLENAFFDPIWAENDGHRRGRCAVPCLERFEQLFQAQALEGEWQSYDGERLVGDAIGAGTETGMGTGGRDAGIMSKVNNRTLENFYRGAYAVHVHNIWGLQYELGSWIDVITRAHDGFFAGERTNAYGELWDGPRIEAYLGG